MSQESGYRSGSLVSQESQKGSRVAELGQGEAQLFFRSVASSARETRLFHGPLFFTPKLFLAFKAW